MTTPLLQARHIRLERDLDVILDDVSIDISAGDAWVIEGPNGSGKTTLLRILAGLLTATEGELFWCGEPRAEVIAEARLQCAYLGHVLALKDNLSAIEHLQFAATLGGVRDQAPSSEDALAQVGLAGYEDRYCGNMSAGQRKRVALARLLRSPAQLWLLDEPFANLDGNGIDLMRTCIQQHAARGGAQVLTSHGTFKVPLQDLKSLRLGAPVGGASA